MLKEHTLERTIFFTGFSRAFLVTCQASWVTLDRFPACGSWSGTLTRVTRPEGLKGAMDEVKRPEWPPTRSRGPVCVSATISVACQ